MTHLPCTTWSFGLFEAIVNPDDDYFVRTRKFVITSILIFLTPVVFALIAANVHQIVAYEVHVAAIVELLSLCPVGLSFCIVSYVWIRAKRTFPPLFIDVWAFVGLLIIDVQVLCVKSSAVGSLYFLYGFVMTVCRPKWISLHLIHCTAGYAVVQYNTITSAPGSIYPLAKPLQLDGAFDPQSLEPLSAIAATINFLVVTLGLFSVFQEYEYANRKAKNAVAMCYGVSEKLLEYDTVGAKQILTEAVDVDDRLCSAMHRIVTNLEMFRPHIPEYVWHKIRSNNIQHHRVVSGGGEVETLSDSFATVVDASSQAPAQRASPHQRASGGELSDGSTMSSSRNSALLVLAVPNDISPLGFLGPERVGRAYLALINFQRKDTVDDIAKDIVAEGTEVMVNPSAVRKLVNWAHTHALKSRGVLHAFVGDTVQASWSFHSPSTKPALFLHRMYGFFNSDANSGVTIAGGLACGSGTSFVAGDRRQAYIMHVTWRDVVYRLFTISRENNAALVDENTFFSCYHHIVCRWVDVVGSNLTGTKVTSSTKTCKIYELLRERTAPGSRSLDAIFDSDSADYNDNKRSSSGMDVDTDDDTAELMDAVSVAMEDCVRGRYADALRILRYDIEFLKSLSYSSMVDRLVSKCEAALERSKTLGCPGGEFHLVNP